MSGGPSGWLPLILTTLGGGAVGALVTTLGSQAPERRRSRAAVREVLREIEFASEEQEEEETEVVLNRLETSAMLAGLPRNLTELYKRAVVTSDERPGANIESLALAHISGECAELLAAATWHPHRTAVHRWRRIRYLTRVLDAAAPRPDSSDIVHLYHQWEQGTLKQAKQKRNATGL